jgi:hypothetical protein
MKMSEGRSAHDCRETEFVGGLYPLSVVVALISLPPQHVNRRGVAGMIQMNLCVLSDLLLKLLCISDRTENQASTCFNETAKCPRVATKLIQQEVTETAEMGLMKDLCGLSDLLLNLFQQMGWMKNQHRS